MKKLSLIICSVVASLALCVNSFSKTTNVQNGTVVLAAKPSKQAGGDLAVLLPETLSKKQYHILTSAYNVAKADGNQQPEKFQAIILTETLACDNNRYKVAGQEFGGSARYYGCGQVKLQTAKAVLNKHPELWKYMQTREDDEIIANLILNDEFNIKVASKYFMMTNNGKADDFAVTAYNQGPGGATKINPSTFGYTVKVNENVKKLQKILPKK